MQSVEMRSNASTFNAAGLDFPAHSYPPHHNPLCLQCPTQKSVQHIFARKKELVLSTSPNKVTLVRQVSSIAARVWLDWVYNEPGKYRCPMKSTMALLPNKVIRIGKVTPFCWTWGKNLTAVQKIIDKKFRCSIIGDHGSYTTFHQRCDTNVWFWSNWTSFCARHCLRM